MESGVLNISFAQTVTPIRPGELSFGERLPPAPLDPVEAVWLLDAPSVLMTEDASGQRTVRQGKFYTRRGVDLRKGDQVALPEGTFGIYDGPDLDFDHPMTGYDFGWVRWYIRTGG